MTQIKLRRDTSANFTSKNPVLGIGEPAYETDTKKLKIGDGTTAYSSLDYFTGGGGSTEFTVVQPLKLVDGTLTLQIDEQTIQVQNGKLVANLDELGNEVNTLAGDVAGVQADLLKKEDKLTSSNPIIKTTEEKANQVGYEVSGTTLTVTGRYSLGDFSSQNDGIYVLRDYSAGTDDNYVDIPFELGDIIKVPYTQEYYYVSNGAFGFINDDGLFRAVTNLYETNSGYQSRYDTVTTNGYKQQWFLNSTNKVNRTHSYTTITTKATDGYRYVQLRDGGDNTVIAVVGSFGNNTSIAKQIWAKTDDDGVNYEKLLKCNVLRMYPYGNQSDTIDVSLDASQFGLYKGLGNLEDLAPNFETIEAAANQFDVLGTTKINNLSLNTDSSLVINSNGQLGLASTIPTKTSDLTNDSGFITSVPTASADTLGGVKVGDGLNITEDGTLSSSGGSTPENMVTTDTTQTITGSKTFKNEVIFNNTDSEASQQTVIRGGEFSLGTRAYDNTISATNLTLDANTKNSGTFLVQSAKSEFTQVNGSTITSQKVSTSANKIIATTRPSSASSNRNYSVLYSEVDSNYKHKLTINNLSSDLVLAGKSVKDSSGNTFLTSGDKETIMEYVMPDYSTRTEVPWGTDNTAPTDGYVEVFGQGDGSTSAFVLEYTIGGVKTAMASCYATSANTNFRLPVICPKGTVYSARGGASGHELHFISMKGAV